MSSIYNCVQEQKPKILYSKDTVVNVVNLQCEFPIDLFSFHAQQLDGFLY